MIIYVLGGNMLHSTSTYPSFTPTNNLTASQALPSMKYLTTTGINPQLPAVPSAHMPATVKDDQFNR